MTSKYESPLNYKKKLVSGGCGCRQLFHPKCMEEKIKNNDIICPCCSNLFSDFGQAIEGNSPLSNPPSTKVPDNSVPLDVPPDEDHTEVGDFTIEKFNTLLAKWHSMNPNRKPDGDISNVNPSAFLYAALLLKVKNAQSNTQLLSSTVERGEVSTTTRRSRSTQNLAPFSSAKNAPANHRVIIPADSRRVRRTPGKQKINIPLNLDSPDENDDDEK